MIYSIQKGLFPDYCLWKRSRWVSFTLFSTFLYDFHRIYPEVCNCQVKVSKYIWDYFINMVYENVFEKKENVFEINYQKALQKFKTVCVFNNDVAIFCNYYSHFSSTYKIAIINFLHFLKFLQISYSFFFPSTQNVLSWKLITADFIWNAAFSESLFLDSPKYHLLTYVLYFIPGLN